MKTPQTYKGFLSNEGSNKDSLTFGGQNNNVENMTQKKIIGYNYTKKNKNIFNKTLRFNR
jgi:hypothetical protein